MDRRETLLTGWNWEGTLQLIELPDIADVGWLPEREFQKVIVSKVKSKEFGLLVPRLWIRLRHY
jgi:hypothetical protein